MLKNNNNDKKDYIGQSFFTLLLFFNIGKVFSKTFIWGSTVFTIELSLQIGVIIQRFCSQQVTAELDETSFSVGH